MQPLQVGRFAPARPAKGVPPSLLNITLSAGAPTNPHQRRHWDTTVEAASKGARGPVSCAHETTWSGHVRTTSPDEMERSPNPVRLTWILAPPWRERTGDSSRDCLPIGAVASEPKIGEWPGKRHHYVTLFPQPSGRRCAAWVVRRQQAHSGHPSRTCRHPRRAPGRCRSSKPWSTHRGRCQ